MAAEPSRTPSPTTEPTEEAPSAVANLTISARPFHG